jgi:hypothetical protein
MVYALQKVKCPFESLQEFITDDILDRSCVVKKIQYKRSYIQRSKFPASGFRSNVLPFNGKWEDSKYTVSTQNHVKYFFGK